MTSKTKRSLNSVNGYQFAERVGGYGTFELPDGVVLRHHRMEWIKTLTEGGVGGKLLKKLSLSQMDVKTMNGHQARAFQYFGRKVR